MKNIIIKSANIHSVPEHEPVLLFTHLHEVPKSPIKIFTLVKILGKPNVARKRLLEVIQTSVKHFEEGIDPKGNIPRSFEHFLEAFREDILNAVLDGSGIPISDFHAVTGVVYGQNILFGGTGRVTALFMHKTAKERYVIYNLDEHFQEREERTWKTILNSVLDGELHPGDIFYLGTRIPANSISTAELQDILVTLPPAGALKRIQQHIGAHSSFGAIGFQIKDPSLDKKPKKVNPITSMQAFGTTQEQTSKVLGEQAPDIQSTVQKLTKPLLKKLSSPGNRGTRSNLKHFLRAVIHVGSTVAAATAKTLQRVFSKISATKKPTAQLKERLVGLPKMSKYIAAGTLVLIVALIGSVLFFNARANKREARVATETILQTIEEKKNAAEASLIYDNKAQASQLVSEAVALLETLEGSLQKNDEQEVESLKVSLQRVLDEIEGVERKEVTQVFAVNGGANSLTAVDGSIYVVSNAGTIYTYTADTVAETPLSSSIPGSILNLARETNATLTLTSSELYRTSQDGSTNEVVSGVKANSPVNALAAYNDNLYVLSAVREQIIFMRAQGDQYEAGTNWIIDKTTDLSTAKDLTIDGDIYVLLPSGIAAFRSGRERTFTLSNLETPLSNPTRIWTETDRDELFVLDQENERIVVFSKDGELRSQYVAEELQSATDLLVIGNTIFFSDSTGVYRIEM